MILFSLPCFVRAPHGGAATAEHALARNTKAGTRSSLWPVTHRAKSWRLSEGYVNLIIMIAFICIHSIELDYIPVVVFIF